MRTTVDECKWWIGELGLDNWKVYFGWDALEDSYARTSASLNGYVASMIFCKDWDDDLRELDDNNIFQVARHEAVHLLIMRLACVAGRRCVTEDQIADAEEETVRKIEQVLDKRGLV